MKKPSVLLLLSLSLLCLTASAQIDLNDAVNKAKKAVEDYSKNKGSSSLSNEEIIKGLKEALTIGSQNSSTLASKLDGYYKNPSIKIPFPPEAVAMEKRLRSIGLSSQVDKFVLTVNRAAEDAAKSAAPVFMAAIKKMTITDGLKILNGGNNAATSYLQKTTTSELKAKFKPIVMQSLRKVAVTKYWNPLVTAYNKIPMVEKKNPDLDEYVTQKALEGLFYLVAQEELKIRKDPMARVTDLLKKVFGVKG
jgi:uncharacterized protein (UPF0333 family)